MPRGIPVGGGRSEAAWEEVSIAEVPDATSGKWRRLFDEMYRLNGDRAMKVKFVSKSQAGSARGSLKKLAEERGVKLSCSAISSDFIGYLWVEKPETKR